MKTISLKSYGNHGRAGASFSLTSHRITLRACFTDVERAVFTAVCIVSLATMYQTINQITVHTISAWILLGIFLFFCVNMCFRLL
jgi:hypothetical protein